MSKLNRLKGSSIRLGLELEKRYKELQLATGEEEIHEAAVNLGTLFNDNVEFIIWSLKKTGGLRNMPTPEEIRSPARELMKSDG